MRSSACSDPSGSGKTTFLRLINQMETLTGGRIWVGGELVGIEERKGKLHMRTDKDIARQRARIGMVFQRFNLFPHMTAVENVMEAPIQVKGMQEDHGPGRGAGAAGQGGPGRTGRLLPRPAVRRTAAAGGHRPGPGHEAGADAVRRADLGPGPRTGRGGAAGDARPGRGGHHHDRGHPRDGLRPRGGRPGGVHGPGGGGRGRPARTTSCSTRRRSGPGPSYAGSSTRPRPRPRTTPS